MTRVFTDERFPGFEVHHERDNVFHVYERHGGGMHEIDTFLTYPGQAVTDDLAARRAKDYFERMAKGHLSDELADRHADTAHVPLEHATPEAPEGPYGLSNSKSLDGLMNDNVMSPDDVIEAYERVKAMPEGPEREKAMAQVSAMSQRIESSAQELVRRLID